MASLSWIAAVCGLSECSLPNLSFSVASPKNVFRQKLDFSELGLSVETLAVLRQIKYEKPTPVQAGVIPLILQGLDVVGQARTGTGKTAAFSLPLVELLREKSAGQPRALILVPTRELAVQVHQEFTRLAGGTDLRIAAIYGGHRIKTQINSLASGIDVVVGTPGRVIDHMLRGTLQLDDLECVVLDEADRMLDIGFRPAIEKILRRCPPDRQTLLFSATLPIAIIELAKRYMRNPKRIDFSRNQLASETIDQYYFQVQEDRKTELLLELLRREQPQQCIIFCRTKIGTERLYRRLLKGGVTGLRAIHGDLSQPARDSVMRDFRSQKIHLMVATDVVGRGIDVSGISHIINYDIPELCDDYVHRVGRTGRMGKSGVAYTFVTPLQGSELGEIERRIQRPLNRDHIDGFTISSDEEARIKSLSPRRRKIRRAL